MYTPQTSISTPRSVCPRHIEVPFRDVVISLHNGRRFRRCYATRSYIPREAETFLTKGGFFLVALSLERLDWVFAEHCNLFVGRVYAAANLGQILRDGK